MRGGDVIARIRASVTFAEQTLSGDEDNRFCAPLRK
jgi:hypothetical protein